MGVSTNAVLFYGLLLDEDDFEDGYPWDADEFDHDSEDFIAHTLRDLVTPTDWSDSNQEEIDKYFTARTAALDSTPVAIGIHCSYEYPMYYVYIKDTELTAYRGYPQEVNSQLVLDHGWDVELEKFCGALGLPFKKPGYYIASLMG